jgi:hypothetical protein
MAKANWEIDAKDRFLEFLANSCGQNYTATSEDVVSNPFTEQNYDYELTSHTNNLPVIALEIFRIVGNEDDLGQHRTWADITFRLTSELKARGIAGYQIRTPDFNIPKYRRRQFVSETAERLAGAIANNREQKEFSQDGYTFYQVPGYTEVGFSHFGGVRQINPFATASEALEFLLPKKNDQLDTPGRLRTLLILNAGIFAQEESDIRQYFSTENFDKFPNIDRAFFEDRPGHISLVFDRHVFNCYREAKLPDDEERIALFCRFVEHRLSARDEKAFGIVQHIYGRYGSLDRLTADGKDALISCGELLVKESDWPSVLWIIRQLSHDLDPPFPNPMHEQIAGGENYRAITSVRGRLCWLIQKVVVHNIIEQYPSMLDVLEDYAFGQDLYIRSQACVPLSEMATRRRSKLPDGSRFMPENVSVRIKDIAFRMLRDAGQNPALLDDVSNVLVWIKDLSENEALDVIEKLSAAGDHDGVHNRCALLLYFALFREQQFADLPPFDSTKFKDHLNRDLHNGDPRFRTSLIWQMAGGAESESLSYEMVGPYLASFVSGEYKDSAFHHFGRICKAHIRDNAASLCQIILRALEKCVEYIASEPVSRQWNVYDLEEYLDLLEENCAEDCVIDGVTCLLRKRLQIPSFPFGKLAAILGRYKSNRAHELIALL